MKLKNQFKKCEEPSNKTPGGISNTKSSFTPIPSDSPKQVKRIVKGPVFDSSLGLSSIYQSAKKLDDDFLFGESIPLKEDVVDQIYNNYMNFQTNQRYSTGVKHKPACQITKFKHN